MYLPAKTVAQAALKAFENKQLGFQNGYEVCKYRYDDGETVCVIGASIPPKFIEKFPLRNQDRIDTLIDDGLIETDDLRALFTMQRAHDHLCEVDPTDEDIERFVYLLKRFAN